MVFSFYTLCCYGKVKIGKKSMIYGLPQIAILSPARDLTRVNYTADSHYQISRH